MGDESYKFISSVKLIINEHWEYLDSNKVGVKYWDTLIMNNHLSIALLLAKIFHFFQKIIEVVSKSVIIVRNIFLV